MGKVTGFLDYSREVPQERDPKKRIEDWKEFYGQLPEEKLQTQGARCMDCGVPFCHLGERVGKLDSGCPINNLIPDWNDLVYRGKWKEALDRLHKTNNFPEFTGRICPAPCEASCVLGINEPPVTIKKIECAIVDTGFEEGWIKPNPPEKRTGKKVAIVGSGPAGLACADQLNKAGHLATVYERDDRIGGLLMYGVPNPKLEKDLIDRRVNILREEGIEFVTNTEVGKDLPIEDLQKDYDAVVLCCGALKQRDVKLPGRESKGIYYAMEFLVPSIKSYLDSNFKDGNFIDAKDKDVIIIGGGDTATDCVATALRMKCKSLTQFQHHNRPPDEREPDNPWPLWPKTYFMDYAQKEAAAIYGDDPRTFAVETKEFISDENGNVKELITVQLNEYKDENGNLVAKEIPGTEKVWPVQLVLIAAGFRGPEDLLPDQLKLPRDERTNVKVEHEKYTTHIPGLYVAGDMRRGMSLIVWAINEGRGAAREVDRYLMGETNLP